MAAILKDGALRLSGYVGDYYYEDGFTSSDVVVALAEVDAGADLVVHVNSPGGVATEGAAIHALLTARPGRTDIVVEGVAASAASLIAMAGETVTMSAGATMMIHDPSGFTFGTSADHGKTIAGLEALATAYARVYADKCGKTADECREIMKAETWFTPAQAVEAGFADETTERKAEPVAAFDYRVFAHAPKRLTALAKKNEWRLPGAEMRVVKPAPAVSTHQEPIMATDKERAEAAEAELATLRTKTATAADDAVKADRERRAAIMALPEAAGRESLAEHLYSTGSTIDGAKATLAASPKGGVTTEDEDNGLPVPEAYEARRATAAGVQAPGGRPAPKAGKVDLVATMKKHLGMKESV